MHKVDFALEIPEILYEESTRTQRRPAYCVTTSDHLHFKRHQLASTALGAWRTYSGAGIL